MRNGLAAISLGILLIPAISTGQADASLPNPAKSCADVRAYIGADNSMTMESYKALLRAAGADPTGSNGRSLDGQCNSVAFIKKLIISQDVLTKPDGAKIGLSGQVVQQGGVCRLVGISVKGC